MSTSRMAACTRGTLVISEPSPTSTRVPPEQVAWGGSKNKKTRKKMHTSYWKQHCHHTIIFWFHQVSIQKFQGTWFFLYCWTLPHSNQTQESSKVNIIFFKDPEIIHFTSGGPGTEGASSTVHKILGNSQGSPDPWESPLQTTLIFRDPLSIFQSFTKALLKLYRHMNTVGKGEGISTGKCSCPHWVSGGERPKVWVSHRKHSTWEIF